MRSDPKKIDITGGQVGGNGVQINAYVRGDLQVPSISTSKDAEKEKAAACRDALYLTDPDIDRESVINAKGTRVAGTCEWITQNETYRAWLKSDSDRSNDADYNGDTRLLWISGGPGKGKTMMSVFLTEQLKEHTARMENTDLVFFFCSAEDKRRNTAAGVLRGLVHQIIVKRPLLVKYALPYFEPPERIQETLLSFETLWIIFSNIITNIEIGTIFCVLDGLDECENSTLRLLLPGLVGLLAHPTPSSTNGVFKLAILSRDLPGLQGCTARVRIDPDNDERVASDIQRFVSARVEELSSIKGFNDNFRKFVHDALLQRTEGTFLWVGFAIYELLQKQTCTEILETLEDLPSGLPAIYSRMLLRIPGKHIKLSRAILQWVTMADRPLQLKELAAAVGIQANSQMTVEHVARDAVDLCGPLLKTQEQIISLVHQSARDYLLRVECDSNPVLETFRFNSEIAHLELAQKCLDCISQSDLRCRMIDLNFELDSQVSPLLRYAALHWPKHAKSCHALAATLLNLSEFFVQKISLLHDHWWRHYSHEIGEYENEAPPFLHMACSLEIIPWVEAELAKKPLRPFRYFSVNMKDRSGKTALHRAVNQGNEVIVRLLLDKGADLEAKDKIGRTALDRAVDLGNEVVVRLLLDRRADLKAKDKFGKTALHRAVDQGSEVVVRLLLDRRAAFKAKGKTGMMVLHTVALTGYEAMLQLLTDKGANVSAIDKDGFTVLN
ncbi:hypothetical protein COCHEDRAFT_1181709 [Bipolaris maydis C5]|uniref:Uncharacterized protein n=1 Tax=Cochliobolus heterostrophus (strain C5 / ATCC 48332 / race O) TaxID=701091 RepID=M2STA0_COCH5|nr:hypothetical protein COCHEDRAFT_1181709 [Bipolaris maydis C5]KAJ5028815.1 hypothetical protein J3E73DRAFT_380041 [Bipolaris maydis]KAJ6205526.1 NACHT and ankyrin domain protein [Bipolaris maydis]KAJ6272986.1 hypothetical protein PSV08DRAFT_408611 [Bipolaris maydis]